MPRLSAVGISGLQAGEDVNCQSQSLKLFWAQQMMCRAQKAQKPMQKACRKKVGPVVAAVNAALAKTLQPCSC